MSKHTEGPWIIDRQPIGFLSGNEQFAIYTEEACVAEVYHEQDLDLIASAPLLLEGLEGLVAWADGFDERYLSKEDRDRKHNAIAALKAAKGTGT